MAMHEIIAMLRAIKIDLGKMIEAGEEGKVEGGAAYEMGGNVYIDLVGVEMAVDKLLGLTILSEQEKGESAVK